MKNLKIGWRTINTAGYQNKKATAAELIAAFLICLAIIFLATLPAKFFPIY